jgi:sulfotransferase family protein
MSRLIAPSHTSRPRKRSGVSHSRRWLRWWIESRAFDALPYWESAKYIYVGRDTRDVFMSTWNHINAYTPLARELLNSGENAPPEPFLEPPEDIRKFWRLWMTRGTSPWESDGFPYWSHHHHARTYWDFRHLPNLLFVHYNDLKADLEGEMRRIARFLEIDVPEEKWSVLADAATFASIFPLMAALKGPVRRAAAPRLAPRQSQCEYTSRSCGCRFSEVEEVICRRPIARGRRGTISDPNDADTDSSCRPTRTTAPSAT